MRRVLSVFLGLLLLVYPFCPIQAEEGENQATGISVQSPMAVLMDTGTGQVLLNQAGDQKAPAASAIKVMTLLVIYDGIEEGRLRMEDTVQVSDNAAQTGGTRAFLDRGASYKAEDLIKAISVCSANDASVAMAEAMYGSTEAFVAQMNARAKELGANNSQFTTCTGLDDENSYTTAYDLAVIASALSRHRNASQYTAIYMDQINHAEGRVTELTNPNRLVRFYTGCDGYATGSSNLAKYCGVITAKKGETRLVAVILGANDSNMRFDDARTLLEYGFANYTQRMLAKKGEILRKNVEISGGTPKYVNLVAKDDIRVVLKRGEENQIKKEIELLPDIQAPVEVGQKLGTLNVYIGDTLIGQSDAIAEAQVKRATLWEAVNTILRYWIMG